MTFITTTPSKMAAMKRERAYRPEDVPVALGLLEKIVGGGGRSGLTYLYDDEEIEGHDYLDYDDARPDDRLKLYDAELYGSITLTEDERALILRILGES